MPNWNWQDELPVPTGHSGDPRELTYRSTMLPLGSYRNADGTESPGFAWPAMITEPINALSRMAENSRLPDGRMGIPNPQNSENQQDAMTLLYSMYGGNALNGLARGAARAPTAASRQDMPAIMSSSLFDSSQPLAKAPANSLEPVRGPAAAMPTTIDDARNSQYFPSSWYSDGGSPDAGVTLAYVRMQAASEPWNKMVESIQYPNGLKAMSRSDAEAIAMRDNADMGFAAQAARKAYFDAQHAANGTTPAPWDNAWFGFDRAPGSKMSKQEFMKEIFAPAMIMPDGSTGFQHMQSRMPREDGLLSAPGVIDGDLFSDTGKPSIGGAALAAEQSDQQSLLELLGYDARNVF